MVAKLTSAALFMLCVAAASTALDASQHHGRNLRYTMTSGLREPFQREYTSVAEAKLADIERSLAPMYATLPKNSGGRLGRVAAAYALWRHFLRARGWLVRGLVPEPGGGSWDWRSSSPTLALHGRVPLGLRALIDDSLRGPGLDLEALAIIAAMLEVVLVEDSELYLKEAFRLTGVPVNRTVTDAEMRQAMEGFMLIYITTGGKRIVGGHPQRFRKFRDLCENQSSTFNLLWRQTKTWLHDVERSAAYARRATSNPFLEGAHSFQSVEGLVADLHSQYGLVQRSECLGMKHQLLSMESTRGTGRVSFTKFQNSSGWGAQWKFNESKEDLLALGALDVSDPGWPRVIVANYVQSPANCLATHGLHSVCCIDECEALLAEVERQVAAPAGDPEDITRIVAGLESETIGAPRNLSAALIHRLKGMSARHNGLVPLHGRLFAQWMHHAFPNECAHPLPRHWSPPAFLVRKGLADTSAKELLQEVDQGAASENGEGSAEELIPWSHEEDLIEEGFGQGGSLAWTVCVRLVIFLAFLYLTVDSLRSGLLALRHKEDGKKDKQNI